MRVFVGFVWGLLLNGMMCNAAYGDEYYSISNERGEAVNWSDKNSWSYISGGSSCNCTPTLDADIFVEADIVFEASLFIAGSLTISKGSQLFSNQYDLSIRTAGSLIVDGIIKVRNLTFYNGSYIETSIYSYIRVYQNFSNHNVMLGETHVNGIIDASGVFYNHYGTEIDGEGTIMASLFSGDGMTFGTRNKTITIPIFPRPLDLKLIEFNGEVDDNNDVIINWLTPPLIDEYQYTIERSIDGFSFQDAIGELKKEDLSYPVKYTFSDQNPFEGVSFYRLKRKSSDDRFIYSEILMLNCGDTDYEFKLFPNPGKDGIQPFVSLKGMQKNCPFIISIQNYLGQELYTVNCRSDNLGSILQNVDPNDTLRSGTYLITVRSSNEVYCEKLTIEH